MKNKRAYYIVFLGIKDGVNYNGSTTFVCGYSVFSIEGIRRATEDIRRENSYDSLCILNCILLDSKYVDGGDLLEERAIDPR